MAYINHNHVSGAVRPHTTESRSGCIPFGRIWNNIKIALSGKARVHCDMGRGMQGASNNRIDLKNAEIIQEPGKKRVRWADDLGKPIATELKKTNQPNTNKIPLSAVKKSVGNVPINEQREQIAKIIGEADRAVKNKLAIRCEAFRSLFNPGGVDSFSGPAERAAKNIYTLAKLTSIIEAASTEVKESIEKFNKIIMCNVGEYKNNYTTDFSIRQEEIGRAIKTFLGRLESDKSISSTKKEALSKIAHEAVLSIDAIKEQQIKNKIKVSLRGADKVIDGSVTSQKLNALKNLYDPQDLYPDPFSDKKQETSNPGQNVAKGLYKLSVLLDIKGNNEASPGVRAGVDHIKKLLNEDIKGVSEDADIKKMKNGLKNSIQFLSDNLKKDVNLNAAMKKALTEQTGVVMNAMEKYEIKKEEYEIEENIKHSDSVANGDSNSPRFEDLKNLCRMGSGPENSKPFKASQNSAKDIYKLAELLDIVDENRVSSTVKKDINNINKVLNDYNSGYAMNFSNLRKKLENAIRSLSNNLETDKNLSAAMKKALTEKTGEAIKSIENFEDEMNRAKSQPPPRNERGSRGSSSFKENLFLLGLKNEPKTVQELNSALRKQTLKHHPDKGGTWKFFRS